MHGDRGCIIRLEISAIERRRISTIQWRATEVMRLCRIWNVQRWVIALGRMTKRTAVESVIPYGGRAIGIVCAIWPIWAVQLWASRCSGSHMGLHGCWKYCRDGGAILQ